MASIIQLRGGTAAAWTSANPILAAKEMGIETDTRKMKIGDGTTAWTSLAYMSMAADSVGSQYQIPFNGDGSTMTGSADLIFKDTNNHLEVGIGSGQGGICLPANTTDEVAETGELIIYAKNIGGRVMPKWVGPSGVDTPFQPFIGNNHIAFWQACTGTTISVIGHVALAATGTVTTYAQALGNLYQRMQKVEYLVTTAATSAVAGFRTASANWMLGNAANIGGFFSVCRFGLATGSTLSTNRCFVGFQSGTSAPTDVDPSTLTTMVGIGFDDTDTSWQMMHNNASGTAIKISLETTDFAVPTTERSNMFEIAMFAKPNATEIGWRFMDLTTGKQAAGVINSADIPASTTFLGYRGYHSVGGTSSTVGIGLTSLYIENDY